MKSRYYSHSLESPPLLLVYLGGWVSAQTTPTDGREIAAIIRSFNHIPSGHTPSRAEECPGLSVREGTNMALCFQSKSQLLSGCLAT